MQKICSVWNACYAAVTQLPVYFTLVSLHSYVAHLISQNSIYEVECVIDKNSTALCDGINDALIAAGNSARNRPLKQCKTNNMVGGWRNVVCSILGFFIKRLLMGTFLFFFKA